MREFLSTLSAVVLIMLTIMGLLALMVFGIDRHHDACLVDAKSELNQVEYSDFKLCVLKTDKTPCDCLVRVKLTAE